MLFVQRNLLNKDLVIFDEGFELLYEKYAVFNVIEWC